MRSNSGHPGCNINPFLRNYDIHLVYFHDSYSSLPILQQSYISQHDINFHYLQIRRNIPRIPILHNHNNRHFPAFLRILSISKNFRPCKMGLKILLIRQEYTILYIKMKFPSINRYIYCINFLISFLRYEFNLFYPIGISSIHLFTGKKPVNKYDWLIE